VLQGYAAPLLVDRTKFDLVKTARYAGGLVDRVFRPQQVKWLNQIEQQAAR
jgi:hypothetical protein